MYFLLIFRLACYQQAAETESTLALAENVYVNLPTPAFPTLSNVCE